MRPMEGFSNEEPEFWALVKLASQSLQYSERGTDRVKRYTVEDIERVLKKRGLDPRGHDDRLERVARYAAERARLLEDEVKAQLMDRDEAAALFKRVRRRVKPPERLLPMNKQRGAKRHHAYLSCLVNMLTHETLVRRFGEGAQFDFNPSGPLTFARDGMPLRTLSRRMDGAYPTINEPRAAWEVKEFYGTTSYGSRVNATELESALDGHELKNLRAEDVEVEHYVFVDARETLWGQGKPLLCRLVDMLNAGLVDGVFFGSGLIKEWPPIVEEWPEPSSPPSPAQEQAVGHLL